MTPIQQTVIDTCNVFIGLTEKPNNSGFYNHQGILELTGMQPEELFLTNGWKHGWAWCAIASKIIWKLSYTKYDTSILILKELDKLFSPSVAQTEANFKRSPNWVVNDTPDFGSIAIWRKYGGNLKKQIEGHDGIVFDFAHDFIKTYDGNSNSNGGREGIEFCKKTRELDFRPKHGLVLQGFIHLKTV